MTTRRVVWSAPDRSDPAHSEVVGLSHNTHWRAANGLIPAAWTGRTASKMRVASLKCSGFGRKLRCDVNVGP